ncbi:hypothetical protein MMC13_007095 [Lambiella insularis]|nr:hypothetical protein [Lambiella insularis]
MTYALTTTKRKFHRLLDSISNSSTPSLTSKTPFDDSTTTTLIESPAKKPRLIRPTRPTSAYVSTTTPKTHGLPEKAQSMRDDSRQMSSEEKKNKKPNYTPWDRNDFLERLKTFQDTYNWRDKPEKVNEVQWAKRGWRCVGRNRVACAGCGKQAVIILEHDEPMPHRSEEASDDGEVEWRDTAQEELVEQYAQMIVNAHSEDCLWRVRGCDASIQRLPLVHPVTTLGDLRLRYESFVKLNSRLPTSLRLPADFNYESVSRCLRPILLESRDNDALATNNIPAQTLDEEALKLALFGWHAESELDLQLATCNACFRRLGLWLFLPRSTLDHSSEEREAIVNRLDLVEEHRSFCPWVNASAQSGTREENVSKDKPSEEAGWQMVARVAGNAQLTTGVFLDSDDSTDLGSPLSTSTNVDNALREVQDQERWAKLKKLKQVFRVKRVKGGNKDVAVRPQTAG